MDTNEEPPPQIIFGTLSTEGIITGVLSTKGCIEGTLSIVPGGIIPDTDYATEADILELFDNKGA